MSELTKFSAFTALCVCALAQTAVRGADEPTFAKDIAPIVMQNCASCHRPEGAAPFSLVSYEDVKRRGRQVAQVTQSRFMPPWLPSRDAACVPLEGSRGLSDEQIATIKKWIEAEMPRGDEAVAPTVPTFKSGWTLGQPDLILTMPEPYIMVAGDSDILRSFVIPVELDEDKLITAIELWPDNPRALHHVSFLIDMTGTARMLDDADPGPGYYGMSDIGLNQTGSYGGWSLGAPVMRYPAGIVRRLPAKCDFVVNIHFNATGKTEAHQVKVGLHYAKPDAGELRELHTVTLGSNAFAVKAETKRTDVTDEFVLPVDVRLVGLSAHAHYLCSRMNVTATLPDGTTKCLLKVDDWDFNWQQPYQLKEPLPLPAGTRLRMEFDYDNTSANPRNPRVPPKDVRVGHDITDEMALMLLFVTAANPEDEAKLDEAHNNKQIQRLQDAGDWAVRTRQQ